jgi:hypothetical protein
MKSRMAAKSAGGLLAVTGLLGIVILATDQILRESMGGQHWYALLAFVVIDLVLSGYVIATTSGTSLTTVTVWGIIRIVIQFADVATAPMFQTNYSDFANYLFNPTIVTAPNPPGVPAAIIDLILLLEIAIVGIALTGRHGTQSA